MKIGDLAEFYIDSHCWGIIVAVQTFEYEIYWMNGERSWISKRSIVAKKNPDKKCP